MIDDHGADGLVWIEKIEHPCSKSPNVNWNDGELRGYWQSWQDLSPLTVWLTYDKGEYDEQVTEGMEGKM